MFGYLADRLGRIRVMAMTVWLMALGTAIIGLLPTYATIGIAAPLLLLLCRIAQGLALGGETTGSTSYIVESAPENRRGYWLGFTLIFSHLPNAVVAGLVVALQLGAGIKRIQTGRGASLSFLEALSELSGSGCAATSMSLKSTSKPARPVKPAKSKKSADSGHSLRWIEGYVARVHGPTGFFGRGLPIARLYVHLSN